MQKIGIIGGGFTGTMCAVQLIRNANEPCEITIVNERETFNKGIAYNPYSKKHLLNVITSKMSAFADQSDHFLDWIIRNKKYVDQDHNLIANSFLPRKFYGEYLTDVWKETEVIAKTKNISVNVIDSIVVDLDVNKNSISLLLQNEMKIEVDDCVIASGNHIPKNPEIKNNSFYDSKKYFQNPWKIDSVLDTDKTNPILIVGNGLTMVDTVLGLIEQGYSGEIYSISPNGYNILPHRHTGLKYSKFTEELKENISLYELVKLVNKHIHAVKEFGISAEPIIDSIRPHTQRIWRGLSDDDKKVFMSRLRHLWGVARHRIPLHSHDKIQAMRIDHKLHIYSGKILDINESNGTIIVDYLSKRNNQKKQLVVSRIINCTGPDSDLMNLEKSFLKNCLLKGILKQDSLKLGINANTETFEVLDPNGNKHSHLYTIGSSLKGELWESTAVHELRVQAEKLAEKLVGAISKGQREIKKVKTN